MQPCPPGQALPQLPQRVAVLVVLVSQPSSAALGEVQSAKPELQDGAHAPETQLVPVALSSAQARLHAPQCALLVRGSSQPLPTSESQSPNPGLQDDAQSPDEHAATALAKLGHGSQLVDAQPVVVEEVDTQAPLHTFCAERQPPAPPPPPAPPRPASEPPRGQMPEASSHVQPSSQGHCLPLRSSASTLQLACPSAVAAARTSAPSARLTVVPRRRCCPVRAAARAEPVLSCRVGPG